MGMKERERNEKLLLNDVHRSRSARARFLRYLNPDFLCMGQYCACSGRCRKPPQTKEHACQKNHQDHERPPALTTLPTWISKLCHKNSPLDRKHTEPSACITAGENLYGRV